MGRLVNPPPCIHSIRLKLSRAGEANSQLLLSILAVHEVKVDFDAVAALMGPNCTSRAVQEQLKKLKKMATLKAGGAAPKAPATKVCATHAMSTHPMSTHH